MIRDYQKDDERWFAAHPGRRHRVRPAFDGEPEGLTNPPALYADRIFVALIRQIESGWRERRYITLSRDFIDEFADNERRLRERFDLLETSGGVFEDAHAQMVRDELLEQAAPPHPPRRRQ